MTGPALSGSGRRRRAGVRSQAQLQITIAVEAVKSRGRQKAAAANSPTAKKAAGRARDHGGVRVMARVPPPIRQDSPMEERWFADKLYRTHREDVRSAG